MLRDSTQSLVRAIQKKDENTQSPIARISKVSTNKYFLIETSIVKIVRSKITQLLIVYH